MSNAIHSCSYFCERPECIKRQRDEFRESRGDVQPVVEAVMQAIARGWCHPANAGKAMDLDLAEAICSEVLAINPAPAPSAELLALLKRMQQWDQFNPPMTGDHAHWKREIDAALAAQEGAQDFGRHQGNDDN